MDALQGYILDANAYPYDEQVIRLDLSFYESDEDVATHKLTTRQFLVQKNVAQQLTKQIIDILAAPDTGTAWEHILR